MCMVDDKAEARKRRMTAMVGWAVNWPTRAATEGHDGGGRRKDTLLSLTRSNSGAVKAAGGGGGVGMSR